MIKLNGKEMEISPGTTVEQMLLAEGFTLQRIAVERNGKILPKAEYAAITVEDGDVFEVVNFVGGG
ncbi:sulfur carrier protein ThiS [Lachnospiraceae bacterium 46-15]